MKRSCCAAEESPLVTVLPLVQRLFFSSIDRKSFPFSRSQAVIFVVLSIRESLTMKEVAGYLSSSKEQATRSISPLVEAGYVERFSLPDNRVHVYVRLTSEGRRYLGEMKQLMRAELNSRLSEALSPEDVEELHVSLARSVEILKKIP